MTESILPKILSGLPPGRCVFQRINQENDLCRKLHHAAPFWPASPATIAAAVPALAIATKPDLILAAIERHKACNAAVSNTCRLEPASGVPQEQYDEWHRRESETGEAERGAADEMVATIPTTFAGLLALLHRRQQGRGAAAYSQ